MRLLSRLLVLLGSLLLAAPAVSLSDEAYETRSEKLDGAR